jgi:AAA ATPase domain
VTRPLLERDRELTTLVDAAREAVRGTGSVVLLHGEAGIGKSSLVSAIRSELPDGTRMLVGSCDALSTPRTLGPFRDLTDAVGPRLAQALQSGERDQVMDALLDELRQPPPCTLVIEDVHWADEATVDTLRFLVRRIAQLPVVLLLTYRDDELSRDQPLTQLLGDASHAEHVHHLSPQRLTEPAVRELVAGSSLDADEVFALSDGNPYFVSELVASAVGSNVPPGLSSLANTDASRLVHHASEAGDIDALVRYAPIAARDAATSGAHREAAAHYTLALEHEDRFTPAELADLFEECAVERYTIGAAADAALAQRRAVALRRQLPDREALGLSLRWLSRIMWFNGRRADADQAAEEATAVLGEVGDEGLFAFALSNQSQLAMLAHRSQESVALARRAIALATTSGATPVLSHALTNLGAAKWQSGDPTGSMIFARQCASPYR